MQELNDSDLKISTLNGLHVEKINKYKYLWIWIDDKFTF